ncbi:hypothetical protein D3C76_744250 [compost metagenome]
MIRLQWNAGSPGKIVGSAQRHQHQAGLLRLTGHGFSNITQGAVATTGNDLPITRLQRFAHQPLRIPGFPGQPNGQLPALFTLALDGGPNLVVERLLAMQNQQRLAFAHCRHSHY